MSKTFQKMSQYDFCQDKKIRNITCLITLKNNFIACSFNTKIQIFNNILNSRLTIKEHQSDINHIFQMKNGNMISSSGIIKIITFEDNYKNYKVIQIFKDNTDAICKTIELSTSHLVSVSRDGTMKCYMKSIEDKNEYFLFKINKRVFDGVTLGNIYEIPEKGQFFVNSGVRVHFQPKIFDSMTCDYIRTFKYNVISYYYCKNIYLYLGEDKLAIGQHSLIIVFDIKNDTIIGKYLYTGSETDCYINVLARFKKEYLLSGSDDGDIELWKINNDYTLMKKSYFKNVHKQMIFSIVVIDEKKDTIASCGGDGKIVIMRYI